MSRLCQNCIIASITLFQIMIQYYEKDNIYNIVEFDETPTIEFLKSIFIKLETIISQVRSKIICKVKKCNQYFSFLILL